MQCLVSLRTKENRWCANGEGVFRSWFQDSSCIQRISRCYCQGSHYNNESPELEELSFDFTTTKIPVTGGKPTSHLIIDSTKIAVEDAAKLQTFLDTLYGNDISAARLLMPDEVAAIFTGAAIEAITLSTIAPADADGLMLQLAKI